eukprot:5375677-Amphidinium_carterae.1
MFSTSMSDKTARNRLVRPAKTFARGWPIATTPFRNPAAGGHGKKGAGKCQVSGVGKPNAYAQQLSKGKFGSVEWSGL